MMMLLSKIWVMQNELRYYDSIKSMVDYVRGGGIWHQESMDEYALQSNTKASGLIQLVEFPDGKIMLHDGHHRGVTTHLGLREKLHDNEFQITKWTYDAYLEINFKNKWVTPFDPRTHIRVADIYKFKRKILNIADLDEALAAYTIKQSFNVYCVSRTIDFVPDLAKRVKDKLCYLS
jgi:hypothetical protein